MVDYSGALADWSPQIGANGGRGRTFYGDATCLACLNTLLAARYFYAQRRRATFASGRRRQAFCPSLHAVQLAWGGRAVQSTSESY
jgi:hypothetical protein